MVLHTQCYYQIAIDNADSSYKFDRSLNVDAWTTLRSTSTEGQSKNNVETDNKSYEKFGGTYNKHFFEKVISIHTHRGWLGFADTSESKW